MRATNQTFIGSCGSTWRSGAAVGYEDAAFFRRLLKRHAGITRGRYRRRFGIAAVAGRP